jgi:outer membrane receptor protein involved in Fe transport
MRPSRWTLWGALALGLLAGQVAMAQEQFSNVTGTVLDQSGAALDGVTVVVTNVATKRTVTVTTGPDGAYYVRDIEPGRYTLKFERQGFTVKEAPNVNLLLGKTIKVDTTLQVGGLQEEMQVVGETPLIDVGATVRGHNVPAEEFDVMPKGRSFQSLATSSPSVNSGELENGITVNGSSSGENNFTVDGVSVNSQLYGTQRQDAVFEHLQEVQVKTSGISAEYGGALGGVISAVTKSGGNEWKGSLFYYYTGDALLASNGAPKRLQIEPIDQNEAQIIQDDGQTNSSHEFGASVGGPLVKDKLFFFGSAVPRFDTLDRTYQISSGQGTIKRDTTKWSAFGKLTYEPTNRLRLNVSGLYTPDKATGTVLAYDGYGVNQSTLTPDNIAARNELGYEIPQYSGSANLDYTLSSTSLLSIRAGYVHDDYKDTGINTSQTYEYATSSVGLAGVPAQYQQPSGFSNLPRVPFTDHDLTTRKFVNAELTKAFHAAGAHNLKLGGGWVRNANDVENAYPNDGFVTVFWDQAYTSTLTGVTDRGPYGYYQIDQIGTIGKSSGDIWHMFIQDNWSVTSRLTLNLGLRAEHEKIPSYRPDVSNALCSTPPCDTAIDFGWGEKLAPRVGFAYDVRGDGKFKLSAAYGRYFDWTKYELARGSWGGDFWTTRYRSLDTADPSTLSRASLSGRNLWDSQADSYQDWRIPSFDTIDPAIKPMAQDLFNAGVEYQLSGNTVLGVNYVHTNLLRTIEDMGTIVNGSESYAYGNPGFGAGTITPTQGLTAPFPTPKAKRNYDAMELTLNRRFSKNWFMGASYVLSKLQGNYPGTVNTDEVTPPGRVSNVAQQSPGTRTRPGTNVSRAWDLDELMWDSHGNKGVDGVLPVDRTHVFKLYGSYQFDFGTNVGINFYGASGTPTSRTVYSIFRIPLLVDGRGSMGRTPFLSQTDLFLSHELKLGGSKRLRLEANILNVFNQQQGRHIYNFLNRTAADGRAFRNATIDTIGIREGNGVDLAAGYDYMAMLQASPSGQAAPGGSISGYQDPRYDMPDIWNPGIQGRLSVRFIF